MRKMLAISCVAVFLSASAALAADLSENTAQTNARSGSVSSRSPGSWIQSALTRHRQTMADRFSTKKKAESTTTTTGGGSTGLSGGLSSLLGLLGGDTSSLGSLSGLLGGSSGTTGTSSGGTTGSSGDLTEAEVMAMIQDSLSRQGGLTSKSSDSSPTTSTSNNSGSSKFSLFAQSNSSDLKFRQRLVNSLLSTFFTSLTFGLQSRDVIDALEDAIRPLFTPISSSNSGGSSTGEGVEDLDPSSDGNTDGASDSVVFMSTYRPQWC